MESRSMFGRLPGDTKLQLSAVGLRTAGCLEESAVNMYCTYDSASSCSFCCRSLVSPVTMVSCPEVTLWAMLW